MLAKWVHSRIVPISSGQCNSEHVHIMLTILTNAMNALSDVEYMIMDNKYEDITQWAEQKGEFTGVFACILSPSWPMSSSFS